MADAPYDFAVLGSTPLAALLAGCLALNHGKRVVLCGEPPSPFRLPRSFDLSAAPITRPESWALLKHSVPDTLKLIRGFGNGLYRRIDPLLIADTEAGREALGHIRHVAAGMGFPAERHGEAVRVRDVALLRPTQLAVAMRPWLDRAEVLRPGPGREVTIRRDGVVRIDLGHTSAEAVQAILCDDAVILGHLGPDGERLRPEQMTAILTEPTAELAAPAILRIDTGTMLVQRRGGAIAAVGPEKAALALREPARYAARAAFRSLVTVDGAPLIGVMRGRWVIAGLGPTAAFLAPAIARFVVGRATETETAWFTAHDPGKGRGAVAEFGAAA